MLQFTLSQPKVDLGAIANLWIALIAVSFAPIFIRLSETDLGPNATVLNRMLVFFVLFGLGQAARKLWTQRHTSPASSQAQQPITRNQWFLLLAVGLVSATTLGLWAISLTYTTVAKSMLLNNLTPIFASAGSWVFLGRRFDSRFITGIAIAVVGALFLGLEDLHGSDAESLIGDAYALLSAVFLGAYFLLVEQLRTRFDSTTILLCRCAVGVMILIPLVCFTEGQVFPTSIVSILAVLGLGVVSEGLGQNLIANCMSKFSSSFVSLFLLLEPIVSALLGWLIFAENLSVVTGVGFGIILSGIYLAQSSQSSLQAG